MKYYLIILLVLLSGCANNNGEMESRKWQSYYKAKEVQMNRAPEKQFEIDVSPDGKFQGITMYHKTPEVNIVKPSKEFHPGWNIAGNVVKTAVPYAGFILGAKTIGDSLTDIVKSGNNPVTYNDSYNTTGRDYSAGDMGNTDYSAANLSSNETSTDNSIDIGDNFTGDDYYPDSSDNSDNSIVEDNSNVNDIEDNTWSTPENL